METALSWDNFLFTKSADILIKPFFNIWQLFHTLQKSETENEFVDGFSSMH